ncbi:MAG: hypothetical protein ACI4VC_05925 [Clostridia bacterium]
MTIVKVPEGRVEEFLTMFTENSCFTFEGLDLSDKESNKLMEKNFRAAGFTEKDFIVYVLKGSTMNDYYGLTDSNAYNPELTIAVIPNFYNPILKMIVGARWFDDIVASNCIKQNAIKTGLEPDYH